MNLVSIQARIIDAKPLRYTLAGIPVQEIVLGHCSDIIEAGHTRKVECVLSARAIGDVAKQLQNSQIGTELRAEGFLANARKNSTKVVLHIQTIYFKV